MLPRPATIAAPPTTASPASWNPAVPPPPVTGAAVGAGLNEGLGDGLAEGLGLGDADGLGEELTLTLVDALGEVVATLPPSADAGGGHGHAHRDPIADGG